MIRACSPAVLRAPHEGCLPVFTHTFENRVSAPRSAAGWTVCIDGLVSLLDGTTPTNEAWVTYLARYGDEFGSDGVLTRAGDSAVLRFERVLDHPVDEVWRALTEPDRLLQWLADVDIDTRQGGRIQLRLGQPAGYEVSGAVTRIDPPKVLEYTWTSPASPTASSSGS